MYIDTLKFFLKRGEISGDRIKATVITYNSADNTFLVTPFSLSFVN